jgi:hypothetical protein
MLVDDEDFERMSQHKWYFHLGYALSVSHVSGNKKNRQQRYLAAHRFVLGLEKGNPTVVDHKDGDRLNNCKENLRRTDFKGNARNSRSYAVSGYKGVLEESSNCYVVRLHKKIIGYYPTAVMAAKAYDQAARETQCEYAWLNFPEVTDYSDVEALPPRNVGDRTSKTIGVSYSRTRRAKAKWRAVHCKVHLGWFQTEEEAMAALKKEKNESQISA